MQSRYAARLVTRLANDTPNGLLPGACVPTGASPPDAVAANSVMKRLRMPRRAHSVAHTSAARSANHSETSCSARSSAIAPVIR